MDAHKKRIKGFRGHGHVCSCCQEAPKKRATRMARRRLKASDRRTIHESVDLCPACLETERLRAFAGHAD
jgi:hypothetical protein